VVLDFGKPAYRRRRGGYGTLTFSNRFASNTAITWATKSYARGYVECLPKGARTRIILVRGTSNYRQFVPSTFARGQLWARETIVLAGYLLYNYGSLDGGPGGDWNVRQAYYVAAGKRYAWAVTEIHNHAMAKQWAYLSRLSVEHFGKPGRLRARDPALEALRPLRLHPGTGPHGARARAREVARDPRADARDRDEHRRSRAGAARPSDVD
jgi:hypothetical protein